MKPTTSNRTTNVMTIIAFIAIYASILVVFCHSIIGFPIFFGSIAFGLLTTFNVKKPEIW